MINFFYYIILIIILIIIIVVVVVAVRLCLREGLYMWKLELIVRFMLTPFAHMTAVTRG